MGSLPSEQHMDNSTTPSWNSECRCGLGLQSLQRTHGMDSGQVNIHTYSKKIYTSQVDLLASRLNHQLPKYVSQHPDPEAMSVDAMHMTLQWNKWTSFIHPPPPIVMRPRILKKIREDQSTCLLIAPNWPAQTWYPLLLQLLIDIPAILPMSEHTIYLPFNRQAGHPLWRTLKLAVAAFRGRCEAGGLPPQVGDILMASWRDGAKKRYEGPWKLWTSWCLSRNTSPFSATITEVLLFHSEQFNQRNLSY